MFSLGKTPYPGIEPGLELYDKLSANYRMSRPEFSPHNVYRLMLDCWAAEPKHRPRFRELADILGDLLGEGERDHYIRLQEQISSGLRSEILERFASPDYVSMTGLREDHENYLVPNGVKSDDNRNDINLSGRGVDTDIHIDNGYLVPNKINSDSDTLPSDVKLNFTKC